MQQRFDMHCHSTCSDGTLAPRELVDLAKEIGLAGLSITDHDTLEAYPDVLHYAAKQGVEMISGIEFSCQVKGKSVHILGYSFPLTNQAIRSLCQQHKERREKRLTGILEKLKTVGLPLLKEEVTAECPLGTIGRPHIALAMQKKGYITTIEEGFKKYLGGGKPCFVPGEAFPAKETIQIIQQAGGVAVLAHPHLIKDSSTLSELLAMEFNGLEGYYSRFDKETNLKWVKKAAKKGWFVTGGSDFHGSVKPHISLGCSFIDKETFDRLKTLFDQSREEDERLSGSPF